MRLILVTVAWALGITLARALPGIESLSYVMAAALAAVAALALHRSVLRSLCILLVFLSLGAARQSVVPRTSAIAAFNGYSGTISGLVVAEPVLRDDRLQVRLDVESAFVNNRTMPSSGLVLVETDASVDIAYGDMARATGALDPPGTGDTFSYADYLGRQGVFSIMRHAAIEVESRGHGSPLMAALLEIKDYTRRLIARELPEPQAGLLTGILLGDERGISPELEAAFERVGASHIIAISGFNMVIVSAMVLRVFSGVAGERRRVATISAVAVIGMYSLFVGASPGILRAALMSSLLVIGKQLRRQTFLPTSLACAALLLSLLDPNVLLDLGFQLSFCAVLGLGLFADPLSVRFLALLERFLPMRLAATVHSLLNEPLIVSIAAQIATMPLIVLYFGRLSLASLPVNLLIVPLQSAVLLLGFASVAASALLPALGTLPFWVEHICLSWTIAVVRAFSRLDFADVGFDVHDTLIQAFYLLMIGGAMLRAACPKLWQRLEAVTRRRAIRLLLCGFALAALVLMWGMCRSRADGKLHLWFLDLGHANAALIQSPGGAQVLVDGGRFRSRLLTALGDRLPWHDRQIELLFITQPDEWDIAALEAVLERYTVGAWLYHGQPNSGAAFSKIKASLERKGARAVEVKAGYDISLDDGTRIEVLHPPAKPSITDKLGDSVVVLRVSYGDASFLLTSDLSRDGQRDMLERGVSAEATVMQVPQHAGVRALDDEFLRLAQPQVVVLQSDPANRRGDPDPDTLDQLAGLRIFRTDEMGAIHLWTDGETLFIDGSKPSPRQAEDDATGFACRLVFACRLNT